MEVSLGSYPILGTTEYKIIVTVEDQNQKNALSAAMEKLPRQNPGKYCRQG